MIKRDVLNSRGLSELKKRRRRAFLNKALIYLFVLLVVVAFATYLSRLAGLNIKTVEAGGNNIVDTENIRAVTEREISGKYLWLFPKTNVLFYPKSAIRRSLASAYPRLKDIELQVKSGGALLISVTEREPLYTWCGENIPEADTAENQICYFLDKEGYVFDEAPYFSGDVYFKFYGAFGVVPLYPKGSYFAREYFVELAAFKDAASALGLEPSALYLKDDLDAELYLHSTSTTKPKILIKANTDMAVLAANLEVALQTEPLKTRFQKERRALEYLDLRFENKVYSKFSTQ